MVRRNRFHEFEIWEEERASEFYDLNYDNRYEDKYDKMLRKRDPSLDIPLTHLLRVPSSADFDPQIYGS